MEFKKPRGTNDWFGLDLEYFNQIKDKLHQLAKNFGFEQIDVPTFENLNLFKKSIGEVTDIAQKELYTFTDKKDRLMALRPEGTSPVVRAYVENKLYANKVNATKYFYTLNLFRYERPQSGRLREFHQFGVEYLNVTNHLYDIECLLLANSIIESFNLSKYVELKINYLGNFEQRKLWIEELKKYFAQYKNELTLDSQNRLDKNPLRILDDKVDGSKEFVKQAPKLNKFLKEKDLEIFNGILKGLEINNIKYSIDDSLVRGLDYYTGVVFEFIYKDPIDNSEYTIIGGGRYDNLVQQTGGPEQIGLGFAMGLERLLIALKNTSYQFESINNPKIIFGADSYETSLVILSYLHKLRQSNIFSLIDLGNYKKDKNARFAIKNNANFFCFVTKENLEQNQLIVENLINNTKFNLTIEDLIKMLKE